jgi:hypothetical protein
MIDTRKNIQALCFISFTVPNAVRRVKPLYAAVMPLDMPCPATFSEAPGKICPVLVQGTAVLADFFITPGSGERATLFPGSSSRASLTG